MATTAYEFKAITAVQHAWEDVAMPHLYIHTGGIRDCCLGNGVCCTGPVEVARVRTSEILVLVQKHKGYKGCR